MNRLKQKTDRRKFLKGFGRNSLLLFFTAGGAVLVSKKPKSADHSCHNRFICRDCRTNDTCQLPQALSAREVMQSQSHQTVE